MKKNLLKKILFVFAVLSQIAIYSYMIAKRNHLLKTGKPIMLKCEPVDPRSLFSGDYVILNYEISRLDIKLFDGKSYQLDKGDRVYVGLEKEKIDEEKLKKLKTLKERKDYLKNIKFHQARTIVKVNKKSLEKLNEKYSVVMKGTVISNDSLGLRVRYGVEDYFVPQFEGKKIEKQMSGVSVLVVISQSGESAIKKLFINEKEVQFR